MGKSIYTTDYSSRRPGFQLHLQKARGLQSSKHHPPVPKKPDRKTMRAHQTGNYLDFKEDFVKALSTVSTHKPWNFRLDVDVTTPDDSRSAATHSEKALLQKFIQPTLELVEEAWRGEVTSTKRDRDRHYTVAGQKAELHSRSERRESKAKRPVLPGVNKWLRSSNEYEKAVVHNFMNTLNNASSSSVHMKQSVPKATEKKTTKPQFTKELYFQQRAKSARSQRVTERPTLPPRPKSVRSVRDEDKVAEITQTQVVEQAHPHHFNHPEGKCEFCDYLRVKRLLEHLNKYGSCGMGEATLTHLLRPRVDPTYNTSSEDYDYVHENSFFTNTSARDRGYFIIAPDWVSERKGVMSTHYQ